jgi:phosphatidylserine/phosphatidylglycerophosphate/cardiolipin synthase-like enzyme
MKVFQSKNGVSLTAYQGDALTLLAFDLATNRQTNFTGFSIRVTPLGRAPYYLFNLLGYPAGITYPTTPGKWDLETTEFSPIQRFSWIHVPSTYHHIDDVFFGDYTYEITPRYLIGNALQPIDPTLTVAVTIPVCPFKSKALQIGFTRSFVASQAAARHFGNAIKVRPANGQPGFGELIFNTKLMAGKMPQTVNGVSTQVPYSYDDLFTYLGWQTRARIFEFLEEALKDPEISLDVFAFDLDEPMICDHLITLAEQGRCRVLLDNSKTHVTEPGAKTKQYEDLFAEQFTAKMTGNAKISRGHFSSLAHSKVFIQIKNNEAIKVLTGSTNFSTNGLYVNANNVLIFDNPAVAALYEQFFMASWPDTTAFKGNVAISAHSFSFNSPGLENNVDDPTVPKMTIRCSPHDAVFAQKELDDLAAEADTAKSILFAIMNDRSGSPLLKKIMAKVRGNTTFTMGITDSSKEVLLYSPNSTTGIHVTGRGLRNILPKPFIPESTIQGVSVHHKFVVLNFNTDQGMVICGSSNLALGPEQQNGDNLLVIRDPDVVTAFAIEAFRLVDHFQFRDRSNQAGGEENMALHTDSEWVKPYFTDGDMKSRQRQLLTADQPNQ